MTRFLACAALLAVSTSAAWGATDATLAACVAGNAKEIKAIYALNQKGVAAREISAADEKDFKASDARLKATEKSLAKDDLTRADCAAMEKELAKERTAVEKLLAGQAKSKPSPVAACLTENLKAYKALAAQLVKAEGAKNVSDANRKEFTAMGARLGAIEKSLGKSGLTLSDCANIGKDIASETKTFDKLSSN